jgi:PPK2 family polyphosphate:nucleotide phosphotransferase
MDLKKYRVGTSGKLKLSKFTTGTKIDKESKKNGKEELCKDVEAISDLQYKLFAEDRQSLLIIFQGMDASGKDGAIKHIMKGINPQGIAVHSFKHPTTHELEHDYLWRHVLKLPEHGQITIFNRSHYENVLIAKVHPEIVLAERLPGIQKVSDVTEKFWERRYKQISAFEKNLNQNGTAILKFFLHISKKEQAKRLIDRIDDRERHWKYSSGDIVERGHWDKYQKAYEDALNATSTDKAPWYIIPADEKDFARRLIGKIILEKLQEMNPVFPEVSKEELSKMKAAKIELLKEIK